jgi:hypothetical protein
MLLNGPQNTSGAGKNSVRFSQKGKSMQDFYNSLGKVESNGNEVAKKNSQTFNNAEDLFD